MKRNSIYYLMYVACILAALLALWGLCTMPASAHQPTSPRV